MKLWIVLILAITTAGATKPSTSPATRPSAADRRAAENAVRNNPALQSAIADLTKEINGALRSGKEPPRQQSDYFTASASASAVEIPPAAVILALRRPTIGGVDPRAQAYVKWQLLSALPVSLELEEKAASDLVQVYRDAPPPNPRLGMDKQSRDDLDRLIRNAKKDDVEPLTEAFEKRSEAAASDNVLILTYRNALFAKLPPSYDAIAAGFDDIAERIDLGIDPADHAKVVLKAIESWTMTSETPPPKAQLQHVAQALKQLEKRQGQEFYSKLRWSDSTGKLSWTKSRESLSGVSSQLKNVQEFVDERIKGPDAPLKLKSEK